LIKHEATFISRKFPPFFFLPSFQKIRDYKNGSRSFRNTGLKNWVSFSDFEIGKS